MAGKRNPSDPAGPSARPPKKPQTIELEASEFAADSHSPRISDAPPAGDSPASSKDGVGKLPSGTNWPLIGAGALASVGLILDASVGPRALNPAVAPGQAMVQSPVAGAASAPGAKVLVIFAAAAQ